MKSRIGRYNEGCHTLVLAILSTALILNCAVSHPVLADTPTASADLVMEEVRSLVGGGDCAQALSLLAPYAARPEEFPTLFSDHLVILVWAGRADEALPRFEAMPPSIPRRPYLLRNMAKAYFDRGDYERAASLYSEVVALDPEDQPALAGWMQALALTPDFSNNAERQYALAHLFENQELLWEAAQTYKGIQDRFPDDQKAMQLRLRALSSLGATSVAERLAEGQLPSDDSLRETLRQDAAVNRIKWKEYKEAGKRGPTIRFRLYRGIVQGRAICGSDFGV